MPNPLGLSGEPEAAGWLKGFSKGTGSLLLKPFGIV